MGRSPKGRTLRLGRVADRGKGEVHHASLVVDAVPEAPDSGDLVLPLVNDPRRGEAVRRRLRAEPGCVSALGIGQGDGHVLDADETQRAVGAGHAEPTEAR